MRMIQSTERVDRKILDLKQLTPDLADKKVWVRARLQTSRSKGMLLHVILTAASVTFFFFFFFSEKISLDILCESST